MDSGYQNFRANGGLVGRKQGYRKSDEAMKEEYAEEIRLIRKGYSLRNVSKLTHTSVNTLRKLRLKTILTIIKYQLKNIKSLSIYKKLHLK